MSAPASKHFSRFLSNDGVALDILVVIALTAILMLPWFQMGWNSNWRSIESTFIADAKFLNDNWPRPLWQPYWYCGTRFDYVYPPALRFGTAAIARYTGLDTSRAYHIYTAFFFCVGIAGVYFLTRAGSRSRLQAWIAAAAATLVSSGLLFFADIRNDNGMLEPARLSALVKYGEGPHMTALAWIPIALGAGWFALRRLTPWNALLGALGCAMVVSNNFYGATALALFFPALVWAVWVTTRDARVPFRAAAIALAGYALTAWWLTPSFLKITLRNLQYVAQKGSPVSTWVLLAAVLAFLALTDRFFRNREDKAWTVFVLGSAMLFTLVVIGFHWFGFRVIGEPNRLVPELDLVLIWLALLALGPMLRGPQAAQRWIAVGMLALAFYPGARFALKSRQWFPKPADPKQRAEYVTSEWMANNRPGSRVHVTGSTRFWWNAWFTNPQIGGGSEQGLLNQVVVPAYWELTLGPEPELSKLWLTVLGGDAIVVNGPHSKDEYKDHQHPGKFKDTFPVLFDNGADDVIYQTPGRKPGLARIVNAARAASLKPPEGNTDAPRLREHAELLEANPNVPALRWTSSDSFTLEGTLAAGEAFYILESHDRYWRAAESGVNVPIRRNSLGFMTVELPPGTHRLEFHFATPSENRLGYVVTAAMLSCFGALLVFRRRALAW